MATNILMPALSPTMTEGTLAKWLKKEGDAIKSGDVIAEIETDKATMEVEAVDEGVLGKILVAEGTEGVVVNAPIAILVSAGEKIPEGTPSVDRQPTEELKAATPEPAPPAPPPAPVPKPASAPVSLANGSDQPGHAERIFASPLARRMAQQAGIDLAALAGSGPNGRIVKADIEAARAKPSVPAPVLVSGQPSDAAPAAVPIHTLKASEISAPHDVIPHTLMRKTIAKRMQFAKQEVPHFYLWIDIEIDALLKLRTELNAQSPKDGPGAFKLSVNDMLVKAAGLTLRRFPAVNASYTEDAMIQYHDVDISVAVAIPEGLITPILRRVDQKGLAAISNEMKDLSERAKEGKLKPEEYQGGSFSISNLGMYGLTSFSAIINPPQSAILAIGAGEKRPVVRNDAIAIATMMTVGIACDHRVLDGATGAEFLAAFKEILEAPLSLML